MKDVENARKYDRKTGTFVLEGGDKSGYDQGVSAG
jgi:hypothetical protein